MSTLKRGIRAGALITGPYNGAFSSYDYAITSDSLYDFLVELKFPTWKVEETFENI